MGVCASKEKLRQKEAKKKDESRDTEEENHSDADKKTKKRSGSIMSALFSPSSHKNDKAKTNGLHTDGEASTLVVQSQRGFKVAVEDLERMRSHSDDELLTPVSCTAQLVKEANPAGADAPVPQSDGQKIMYPVKVVVDDTHPSNEPLLETVSRVETSSSAFHTPLELPSESMASSFASMSLRAGSRRSAAGPHRPTLPYCSSEAAVAEAPLGDNALHSARSQGLRVTTVRNNKNVPCFGSSIGSPYDRFHSARSVVSDASRCYGSEAFFTCRSNVSDTTVGSMRQTPIPMTDRSSASCNVHRPFGHPASVGRTSKATSLYHPGPPSDGFHSCRSVDCMSTRSMQLFQDSRFKPRQPASAARIGTAGRASPAYRSTVTPAPPLQSHRPIYGTVTKQVPCVPSAISTTTSAMSHGCMDTDDDFTVNTDMASVDVANIPTPHPDSPWWPSPSGGLEMTVTSTEDLLENSITTSETESESFHMPKVTVTQAEVIPNSPSADQATNTVVTQITELINSCSELPEVTLSNGTENDSNAVTAAKPLAGNSPIVCGLYPLSKSHSSKSLMMCTHASSVNSLGDLPLNSKVSNCNSPLSRPFGSELSRNSVPRRVPERGLTSRSLRDGMARSGTASLASRTTTGESPSTTLRGTSAARAYKRNAPCSHCDSPNSISLRRSLTSMDGSGKLLRSGGKNGCIVPRRGIIAPQLAVSPRPST